MIALSNAILAFMLSVIAMGQAVNLVTIKYFSDGNCQTNTATIPVALGDRCQSVSGLGPNALGVLYNCTTSTFQESFGPGANTCQSGVGIAQLSLTFAQCTQPRRMTGSAQLTCQSFPDNNVILMQLGTCGTNKSITVDFEAALVINTCLHTDPRSNYATEAFYMATVANNTVTYTGFTDAGCTTGANVLFTGKLNAGCATAAGSGRRLQGGGVSFSTVGNSALAMGAHMYAVLAAVMGALVILS